MKVKGCKHYETKVISKYADGGKVVKPTAQAMGRSAKGARELKEAAAARTVRAGAGVLPDSMEYSWTGMPRRKLPISAEIADVKQMKEGRR